VVADNVIDRSRISGGANGPRATFDTNVQFAITDPAYGQVIVNAWLALCFCLPWASYSLQQS
jgi:hypothetical protein